MARWLVILGLAVAPCIDTAAAAKPKAATAATSKVRRKPVPAAARAAAAPLNVAVTDPPVSDPTAGGRVAAADAGPHAAGPDAAGADAAVRRDAGPAMIPGGCAAGDRRTVSTYYSEGRKTASGAAFDRHAMTAAHRTLPFGTQLTVSNPLNGRSVTVVVNDRGPFVAGIGLDLSLGAAQVIGMRGRAALCVR